MNLDANADADAATSPPSVLHAKQTLDLRTSGFNRRLVHQVIRDGFLHDHVPTIQARRKQHRDAMRAVASNQLLEICPAL